MGYPPLKRAKHIAKKLKEKESHEHLLAPKDHSVLEIENMNEKDLSPGDKLFIEAFIEHKKPVVERWFGEEV